MDARRDYLVRLLQRRRRRIRLLLACLATALACGAVTGLVVPQVLTGSIAGTHQPADGSTLPFSASPISVEPLDLSERLQLDPRQIQANTMRWAAMPEAEREQCLDRYWRLAQSDPAEQDRLFQEYSAFRQLPPDEQETLRRRAKKLQAFINTLSPQDQALLESMSDGERAKHLLQLWQTRYGSW
ncbi:MAG TPA: DUF3106 domain-containing protein [Phycisphaerae bacterium]|nr:DUF3106 domain-containing protein [Phycisphaerae bacterium]